MRIYNEAGEIMDESQVDLSKGYLMSTTRVRDGAAPIDNVSKFAWDDGDYEEIQCYIVSREVSTKR